MPELVNQIDVRSAHDLTFCYLCGQNFTSRSENHPDHVPPKAIFAKEDRNFPLKVASHAACNEAHSLPDEVLGQLIAVSHGKYPNEDRVAIEFRQYQVEGFATPFMGCVTTNIKNQIVRWMRGFHAALYQEYLPTNTPNAIHLPFPNGSLTEDGFIIKDILDQQYLFVDVIKKNRIARQLDRIVCNNGRLQYECVWMTTDQGDWSCVFALQIYDWVQLADANFPKRGCVGWYQPVCGRPTNGAIASNLVFPYPNLDRLNAFAE
jgi:hypothetical protein